MDDPPVPAGSVADLLSPNIQPVKDLYQFYASHGDRNAGSTEVVQQLSNLLVTLETIDNTLRTRVWQSNEWATLQEIKRSIIDCKDVGDELQNVAHRLPNEQSTSRQKEYPFRESTLLRLKEDVADHYKSLSPVLQALQLGSLHDTQSPNENTSVSTQKLQDSIGRIGHQFSNINIDGGARVHIGDSITTNDTTKIEALIKTLQAQQLSTDIHQWLSAPDAIVDYNIAHRKHHEATGQWFTQGSSFNTWLQQENSFLWLYGFAGCGKSVLCSTAIQKTLYYGLSCASSAVGFFFFTFNDTSKQDASAALKALLFQLCKQVNGVEEGLIRLKKLYNDGTPPVSALLEQLRQAITRSRQVYILLDALDESPVGSSRDEVLSVIESMRQWQLPNLHLLVTSRDAPDIRHIILEQGGEHVSLKNEGVEKDISRYISSQVDNDRQLQRWGDHREKIKSYLAQHAGGVFRWVECQLGPLRQCIRSEKHLEKCLRTLPRSLDETYERMLCDIESREEARQILSLLCYAPRPLSIDEIAEALAVDTDKLDCYDPRSRFTGGAEDLLRICPGLIEISFSGQDYNVLEYEDASDDGDDLEHEDVGDDGENLKDDDTSDDGDSTNTGIISIEVVRIAHFSVQEYLLSDRIRKSRASDFAMFGPLQHGWISKVCLLYLCYEKFLQQALSTDLMKEYALARYAAEHWHYHYFRADSGLTQQLSEMIASFLMNQNVLDRWTRLHNPDRPGESSIKEHEQARKIPSPTYYASLLGLDVVLKLILSKSGTDVNAQRGAYGTALRAASIKGHEKAVQILVDAGAEVNARGVLCNTALRVASAQGYEKVVQILLAAGSYVNDGGGYGTALHLASIEGHEKVVRILLEANADIYSGGILPGYPLQLALVRGNEEIIQLLVDAGADVNTSGERYGTTLQAVFQTDQVKVFLMLVAAMPDSMADARARLLEIMAHAGHTEA